MHDEVVPLSVHDALPIVLVPVNLETVPAVPDPVTVWACSDAGFELPTTRSPSTWAIACFIGSPPAKDSLKKTTRYTE